MILIVAFFLLAMAFPLNAATWYVSPNGSGTACTESNPCNWIYGTQTKVSGSDTVRFFDGVYHTPTSGWHSTKTGTSPSARITFEAINRRKAIIRYVGPNDNDDTFIIQHSNYIVRGLEINCEEQGSGDNSWDCLQARGRNLNNSDETTTSNVLFDDLYVRNSGHGLFHCTQATNIELKNSTLDLGGETSERGEGFYLASCCGKNNPCVNFQAHHNIVSRYGENGIDFKDQTRSTVIRDSIFNDQRARVSNSNPNTPAGSTGVAVFIAQGDDGFGTTAFGTYITDTISFRGIATYQFSTPDAMRFDAFNNVIWGFDPVSGGNGKLNHTNSVPQAEVYGNIHCPASDSITENVDLDHGKTANKLNRPNSECETRINEILGVPGISSCEIGSLGNTTLVVNLQADKNGPISSVGSLGQLAVQYNLTDQTETAVQLTSGTQARITLATQPSPGQSVRVVPAIGAIKNSAFIGGKDCTVSIDAFKNDPGGSNINPNTAANGGGVCGTNIAATPVTCTNNVGGPPPPAEGLNQAVWRFYGADGAEGEDPLSAELANISLPLGTGFRWRVGVRGGGTNAANRAYELGARICNPTCGNWAQVTTDFSSTGVTYRNDAVQINLTPTTNQLSLGGKTFLAGAFIEGSLSLPSVAISTTQQVEWEFSLILPEANTPLAEGHTLELRMQHNDGTALATYTLPSITISQVSVGYGGSFGGSVMGGVLR